MVETRGIEPFTLHSLCNVTCKWHKRCARFDRRGHNKKAWCQPDLMRHGFIERKRS